ncbi:hypothetical protein VE02_05604 [Pseudogymnoascus sp. 03VT05]|nr:hypothetical protein VE02_05604 [Pseudogymnoascus sp. 03VT05]
MSSRPSSLGRRKRGSQSPTKRGSDSPSKSSATPNTTSTRSTGPYDRAFQQHLIDHDILPNGYEYPDGRTPPEPENMDEIVYALGQPRASLSPNKFSNEDSSKETLAITISDGTLVPGNPDLYYGARPEQVDQNIRRELSRRIVPSTQHDLPVAPNFFLQVKGPDGSLAVASRQASYDGALGARAIHSLQSFGVSEPRYDNNAYTITSIYHGGQLKMYTSHPISPSVPGAQPGNVMTQINTWGLTGDADTFRKEAAAYRNGRDWAKRQRDSAIKQAHANVTQHTAVASSLGDGPGPSFTSEGSSNETIANSQQIILNLDADMPPSYESETSADELSEGFHRLKRRRSHSPRKKQ